MQPESISEMLYGSEALTLMEAWDSMAGTALERALRSLGLKNLTGRAEHSCCPPLAKERHTFFKYVEGQLL